MQRRFYNPVIFLLPLILAVSVPAYSASNRLSTELGYSILRLFLVDEHYLTAIRRVKSIFNFGGINESTAGLVDEIATSSETALRDLESLVTEKPVVKFDTFDEKNIAITTFDALRYSMAKQLFLDSDNFEKNLLLSQVQILPVITHLILQLEENETNQKRKTWLRKLGAQYSDFYKRTNALLNVASSKK